jgi:alpha-L-fucosidase
MVSEIQPQIIFNGRNGLPGDFCTPEGHMAAPVPWRPWEACMTLNEHWGFHKGDCEWKTAKQVAGLLINAAAGNGNLLLNIGPRGDGSIPERTVEIIEEVGIWLKKSREAIFKTAPFTFGLEKRAGCGDWSLNGSFTARGKNLYHFVRYWTGEELVVAGIQCKVLKVSIIGEKNREVEFVQKGDRVLLKNLPEKSPDPICPVIRLECDREPEIYLTAGMRIPKVAHPPYDPCPSDIKL